MKSNVPPPSLFLCPYVVLLAPASVRGFTGSAMPLTGECSSFILIFTFVLPLSLYFSFPLIHHPFFSAPFIPFVSLHCFFLPLVFIYPLSHSFSLLHPSFSLCHLFPHTSLSLVPPVSFSFFNRSISILISSSSSLL